MYLATYMARNKRDESWIFVGRVEMCVFVTVASIDTTASIGTVPTVLFQYLMFQYRI